MIRIAYLALWALPALLLRHALNVTWPELLSPRFLTPVFIGYLLAQWLHLLCDRILPFAPSRPSRSRRPR